jgi:hypothetical protein
MENKLEQIPDELARNHVGFLQDHAIRLKLG